MKNKITWEQVYQLPLKYDEMLYAWSKNNTMALMFNKVVKEDDRETIVKTINGESDMKIEGLDFKGCDFFINGNYAFCVRGWGYLTGIGGLGLTANKACEIQYGFIRHIYEKLCFNPNTKHN